MHILFAGRDYAIPELYEGIEDLPGLQLTVHLHTWVFPEGDHFGEARFRVEIREAFGQEESAASSPSQPIGTGFVRATQKRVLAWSAPAPLAQALLDGLLGHENIQLFFTKAAQEALQLPEDEHAEKKQRVPLKLLKAGVNPFLQ